ncbi:unnamed protein product [Mesocestoides corti]|uniref:Uncharacterized protein n=1 Tax=Mesocestoides corti TaxID=53468 RepID=A0A0R3U6C5_MESCO|nr:unnamed protein product [Mesocestoides corti]
MCESPTTTRIVHSIISVAKLFMGWLKWGRLQEDDDPTIKPRTFNVPYWVSCEMFQLGGMDHPPTDDIYLQPLGRVNTHGGTSTPPHNHAK